MTRAGVGPYILMVRTHHQTWGDYRMVPAKVCRGCARDLGEGITFLSSICRYRFSRAEYNAPALVTVSGATLAVAAMAIQSLPCFT